MLKLITRITSLIAMLTLVSCLVKQTSGGESYDAELEKERIRKAEYEHMINLINSCITESKNGHDPLSDDSITNDLLDDSSRVYCSNYTTTLEHKFVRYCRYLVYAEKNKSNIKSCHCELIAKRKAIRQDLKDKCNKLKGAGDSNKNNQAIFAHLGVNKWEDFEAECDALNQPIEEGGRHDCD